MYSKLNIVMLPALVVLMCHILTTHCQNWRSSDFWTHAATTADLSVLRQSESSPVFTKFVPAEITAPLFFPLCGNGRLDTKDDYLSLFSTDSRRLKIPRSSFGSIVMIDNTNLDSEYELSMMADEVCDDGNRKDFDGCSGDCLSVDLWTSSCEIAMDRQLQYEDLLAVPGNKGDMLASAKDGVYLLKKIQPGERVQTSFLMAPKTFPVTNMFFSSSGDLILYSSSQQRLWRLQNGKITNEFDISAILYPWNSSLQVLTDSLILHDHHTLLLLNIEDYSIINQCTFNNSQLDNTCFYVVKTRSLVRLRCDSTGIVYIMNPSASTQCTTETRNINEFSGMNIWQDVFNSMTNVVNRNMEPVSGFDASFKPLFIDKFNSSFQLRPFIFKGYAASGFMFETVMGTPRALLDKTPGLSVRWVGDELNAAWALAQFPSCGPTPCFFDMRMGYNALNARPYANALQSTWMDYLQKCIDRQIALTNAKSLNDIRIQNNGANYRALIHEFVTTFQTISISNEFRTTAVNPDSNNIWMIRGESIFEISRSGIQSRFADGTCLPSNIALCPYCFWADSGKPCIPCIFKDEKSVAWKTSCSSYCIPVSLPGFPRNIQRRLFSTEPNGKVVFVLSGNQDTFEQLWPSASFTSWDGNQTVVVLVSNNISETITDVNRLLISQNTTTVQVQPYGVESGKGVGTLVIVVNNTNQTLVKTLWPNALIQTNDVNMTVQLATSDNPVEDMRSLKIQLLKTDDIVVLVNPYLRLDLNTPPENENDVIFEINSTDISMLRGLWPKGVFQLKISSITVVIPFSGNMTNDMLYATQEVATKTDLLFVKSPSRRGTVLHENSTPTPTLAENVTGVLIFISCIVAMICLISLCVWCCCCRREYRPV
jgi:cysteine-rich repeat protein